MTNNVITILPNGTEICVSTSDIQVAIQNGLCIEINSSTGVNIGAWLSSLNQYESDEAAIADGKSIYIASNADYVNGAHEGAYPGTLIILN
jgi:hypothetical protein